MIQKLAKQQTCLVRGAALLQDPAFQFIEADLCEIDLGFSPSFPLADGMRQQVHWMEKLLVTAKVR